MGRTVIPYLQEVRKRGGRKGDRVLRYYRRDGRQWGSVVGEPGSDAFAASYGRLHALAERELNPQPPTPAEPGTLRALIRQYYAAAEFTDLGARTQKDYKGYLDPIATRYGHLKVASLDRPREAGRPWTGRAWIIKLRDAWKATPFRANYRIACLRRVLNFAAELNWLAHNPAARPRRHRTEARVVMWSWEQQDDWLAAIPRALDASRPAVALTHEAALVLQRQIRRGYFLLAYGAQRPGDTLKMPWTRYDPDKVVKLPDGRTVTGTIKLRQAKRGKLVEVPVHPDLKAELDRDRETETARGILMLLTPDGRPFQARYFAKWWDLVSREAAIADRRRADLRGTGATRMAEGGATDIQISAVTGWSIERTGAILEAYLVRTPALGAAAVLAIARPKPSGT